MIDKTTREALRKPFPPEQIGKLPRTDKRPALDYVGHAAVTDRLNQTIPQSDWSYTVDKLFDHGGTTYIEGTMTVCGISRVEYGDGKTPKEAISNFIRRAAMRFGVALDLWSREELDSSPEPVTAAARSSASGSGSTSPAQQLKAKAAGKASEGDTPPILGTDAAAGDAHSGAAEAALLLAASESSGGGGKPVETIAYGEGEVGSKATPSPSETSAPLPSVEAGSPEGSGASSSVEGTHDHGDWKPAPRQGWVLCGRLKANGKPCSHAEKASKVAV